MLGHRQFRPLPRIFWGGGVRDFFLKNIHLKSGHFANFLHDLNLFGQKKKKEEEEENRPSVNWTSHNYVLTSDFNKRNEWWFI